MIVASPRKAGRGLVVAPPLNAASRRFWPMANRHVLWGWKRDEGRQSRLVYFSGTLEQKAPGITLVRPYFFYKHRCGSLAAQALAKRFQAAKGKLEARIGAVRLARRAVGRNLDEIRFSFGPPRAADRDRTRRLQLRKPRRRIEKMLLPPEASWSRFTDSEPVDLYAGSGVSYEAGLPTLCEMHDAFCLDNHGAGRFVVGREDRLPGWFRDDPMGTLTRFCAVHTRALTAPPTPAQKTIARLHKAGMIRTVLSDNVDNMLCKVNVPFVRTRGSGVFNERFPVRFRTRTLLVIGVAADRRQIVRQARAKGVRVVVVNPCGRVSPRVQHLNYIRGHDLFYKTTADAFFKEVTRRGFGS